MKLSADYVKRILPKSRSSKTSWDPEHREEKNPAREQCQVTAFFLNKILWWDVYAEKITLESKYTEEDFIRQINQKEKNKTLSFFVGTVKIGENRRGYHYFNKDAENIPIRLCEGQFIYDKILARGKEKLLDQGKIDIILDINPEIKKRLEILEANFQKEIEISFR